MKEKIILGIIAILLIVISVGCVNQTNHMGESQEEIFEEMKEHMGTTGETKTFEITAKNWEFIPDVIEVNQGDKVILKITSIDVSHGLMLPAFNVNEMLEPGKDVTVEFIADQTGEHNFFCNVFCGAGHGAMQGTLIVK